MTNLRASHTPFAQLPVENCALFYMFALAALARYRSKAPTPRELVPELETAWNTNRLCEIDLSDPDRMTQFLEEYFAPYASNVTRRAVGQRCSPKASR